MVSLFFKKIYEEHIRRLENYLKGVGGGGRRGFKIEFLSFISSCAHPSKHHQGRDLRSSASHQ